MLLACTDCHRQYDVGDFPVGARVRCTCGTVMRVPELAPRQVEVLYCANCGGKLAAEDEPCAWCEATPEPGEREGGRGCPECFATLDRGASFCSTCGVEIAPQAVLQALADVDCPRCDRPLAITEGREGSFHQCTACCGIWLARRDFERFLELHREDAPEQVAPGGFRALTRHELTGEERRPVRCTVCRAVMLPHEYAALSRVVVDACFAHGWWFDGGELNRLAQFVRKGGLAAAERRRETRAWIKDARARRRERERRERQEQPLLGLFAALAAVVATDS